MVESEALLLCSALCAPGPRVVSWGGDEAQRCGPGLPQTCVYVLRKLGYTHLGRENSQVLQAKCQAGCAQEGLELSWGEGDRAGGQEGDPVMD